MSSVVTESALDAMNFYINDGTGEYRKRIVTSAESRKYNNNNDTKNKTTVTLDKNEFFVVAELVGRPRRPSGPITSCLHAMATVYAPRRSA
uniref:Uncharacterized protein n=1 Tax=Trichogramma kaykai TaxID=54128 RepID=A0ABD2W4N8_9HYME